MPMWIASLLAMFSWSGSDVFSKLGSRQNDKRSHYKVGIFVGLVMGLHALYSMTIGGVSLTFNDIVNYLPASALYILSMVIGYIGLRYIELSISSPICNASGAVAVIFGVVFFGKEWLIDDIDSKEPLDLILVLVGVVFIVVGVTALGFIDYHEDDEARAARQKLSNRKYAKSVLAFLLPITYCLLDAAGTFVDTVIGESYTEKYIGAGMEEETAELLAGDVLNTAYELTWAVIAVAFAIYVYAVRRDKVELRYDKYKLFGGLCETVGQVFYMMVVVSDFKLGLLIISSYCAVSLLWGRIFVKERLSWKHYVAIAMTFVGIAILGFFDA